MPNITTKAEEMADRLVELAGDIIVDDMRAMLLGGEQLTAAADVSPIMDAESLDDITVVRKQAEGALFPELPRMNTLEMFQSLEAVKVGSGAVNVGVFGDRDEVAEYQHSMRPFIGVSDRAERQLNELGDDDEISTLAGELAGQIAGGEIKATIAL